MPTKSQILAERIIALSKNKIHAEAFQEWVLESIIMLDEANGECLCTHYPIRELCEIRNVHTDHHATVGNCCIQKFFEPLPAFTGHAKIVSSLRRIRDNLDCAPNNDLTNYALGKNALSLREWNFLQDTFRKRNLTDKQLAWRRSLNARLVSALIKTSKRPII